MDNTQVHVLCERMKPPFYDGTSLVHGVELLPLNVNRLFFSSGVCKCSVVMLCFVCLFVWFFVCLFVFQFMPFIGIHHSYHMIRPSSNHCDGAV